MRRCLCSTNALSLLSLLKKNTIINTAYSHIKVKYISVQLSPFNYTTFLYVKSLDNSLNTTDNCLYVFMMYYI